MLEGGVVSHVRTGRDVKRWVHEHPARLRGVGRIRGTQPARPPPWKSAASRVLGYWVGVRRPFHLSLFLTAPRMVLPQDPSTNASSAEAGRYPLLLALFFYIKMMPTFGRRGPPQAVASVTGVLGNECSAGRASGRCVQKIVNHSLFRF